MTTTAAPDYEQLLRLAIQQAKDAAPQALADLYRISSRAAEAVARVTAGAAALEIVPIDRAGEVVAYHLLFRKHHSTAPASDLGVYQLTPAGYPVHRWATRRGWDSRPSQPEQEFLNAGELASNFEWILSKPESRLVVLVTFVQEQNAAGPPAGVAS